MPTFDICKVGTSADCSLLYVEDKTVYGVTPDARADFALFLAGFFYQEGADDVRVNIDNTLPETVVTWDVTVSSDGYYYFDLLPILIWTSGLSFSIGDITYQNTFYWKSLTNNSNIVPTNDNGTNWEQIADPYLEVGNLNALGNPVIEQVTRQDEISLCKGNICYGEVVHAMANECCTDCTSTNSLNYIKIDSLLQDAYILEGQTRYTEAHKVALLLQDKCNDLTNCGCS